MFCTLGLSNGLPKKQPLVLGRIIYCPGGKFNSVWMFEVIEKSNVCKWEISFFWISCFNIVNYISINCFLVS